jgi:hypothetical protein
VQRLIKAGLLRSESVSKLDNNALILIRVFWVKLLQQDKSSSHIDSQPVAGFFAELKKNNVFNNNELDEGKQNEISVRYSPDGLYKKTTYINNAASDIFSLSLTWHYDENLVESFLQAAGFSAKQIKQIWFGKYVQYWSNQPIERSQEEWSRHFANHMQSYLLRPDYFEKMNGMLEEETEATPSASHSNAKRATVPRLNDGSQLQAWAITKGLPTAPVGFTTTQYYQLLCNAVERKRIKKERDEKKMH